MTNEMYIAVTIKLITIIIVISLVRLSCFENIAMAVRLDYKSSLIANALFQKQLRSETHYDIILVVL